MNQIFHQKPKIFLIVNLKNVKANQIQSILKVKIVPMMPYKNVQERKKLKYRHFHLFLKLVIKYIFF